jgi:hypothetical protein
MDLEGLLLRLQEPTLTNLMEQRLSWEANSCLATRGIPALCATQTFITVFSRAPFLTPTDLFFLIIVQFYPEDRGSRFLRNVNKYLVNYMTSHFVRYRSLAASLSSLWLCYDALSISDYTALNSKMIHEWWIAKDLEGSSYSVTESTSRYLPRRIEEIHHKPQSR